MSGPTPSMNTGVNTGSTPVQFTLDDAARISNVVLSYEGARRGRKPSVLPRAASAASAGTSLKSAYYYGGWLYGTVKQITFAANTAQTATCSNYLQTLTPAAGSGQNPRVCFVMPDDTGGSGYLLVNGGP